MLSAFFSWLIVMGVISLIAFLRKKLRKPFNITSSILTFICFAVFAGIITFSLNKFEKDYDSANYEYIYSYDDLISRDLPPQMTAIMSQEDFEALKWLHKLRGFYSLTDEQRRNFYEMDRPRSNNWSPSDAEVIYENRKFIELFGREAFNSMDFDNRAKYLNDYCVGKAYESISSNQDTSTWNNREVLYNHFKQLANTALQNQKDKVSYDKLPLYALGTLALFILAVAIYALIRIFATKWINLRARNIFIFVASANVVVGIIQILYAYFVHNMLEGECAGMIPLYLSEFVCLGIPLMEYLYIKGNSTDQYFLVPRFIQKIYYMPNDAYLRTATIFFGIPLFCFCSLPFGAFALLYVVPAFVLLTILDAIMWIIAGKKK